MSRGFRMERLRRSCLAVPASSPKMLAKAATLPADEVLIDLEDGVAASDRNDEARQNVVDALRGEWRAGTRVVRVNGVRTRWCFRDIVYVVERAAAHLHCIMLPKVEDAGDVAFADRLLGQLSDEVGPPHRIGLEVQIETPLGLTNIDEIAAASDRIETLVFGPGDFAAAAGIPQLTVGSGDWDYVLWRILVAARAHGLQAIDGPYANFKDAEGLRAIARRARRLGYDGKWAVHPDQIELCNEIFSPSADEYARAQRILAAYEQATSGAMVFEDDMIDEATRKMAQRVVKRGRAAGLSDPGEGR